MSNPSSEKKNIRVVVLSAEYGILEYFFLIKLSFTFHINYFLRQSVFGFGRFGLGYSVWYPSNSWGCMRSIWIPQGHPRIPQNTPGRLFLLHIYTKYKKKKLHERY